MDVTLLEGLQDLRAKGLLCDVFLTGTSENEPKHAAHQVVLAAASPAMRDWLLQKAEAPDGALDALRTAPTPQEVRLTGVDQAQSQIPAALAIAYGDATLVDGAGVGKLASVLGWTGAGQAEPITPRRLCDGLQKLRASGRLCDAVVVAGGRRFSAHQAVLAAASAPLRRFIVDKLRELCGPPEEQAGGGVVAQPLEIELEGITTGEAAQLALDCLYGSVPITQVFDQEVAQDVKQLASSLELPDLRPLLGVESVRKGTSMPPSLSGESPPPTLGADFSLPGDAKRASNGRRVVDHVPFHVPPSMEPEAKPAEAEEQQDAVEEQQDAAAGEDEEAAEGDDAEEGEEEEMEEAEEEVDPEATSVPGNLQEALAVTKFFAFATPGKVPAPPNTFPEMPTNKHGKLLDKLRGLFAERPVWLMTALRRKLPPWADEPFVQMLAPLVAYVCSDGPWGEALVRLGYDPRSDPETAMPLQVLKFNDRFFKRPDKSAPKEAAQEQADISASFKKLPTQKIQLYQYADIQDEFLVSMIQGIEAEPTCDKKAGWLPEFFIDVARDRLTVKSQQLRERMQTKAAASAAALKEKPSKRDSVESARARGRGRGRGRSSGGRGSAGHGSGGAASSKKGPAMKRPSRGDAGGAKRARRGGA